MKNFLKRLRRRRQLDQDLEDELRFHLEMQREETGDTREARLRFGNLSALTETCRDLWTFNAIESVWKDLRYGLRALAKSPGVTITALLALALGIGADTAVFTIVNAAMSYDVGVERPERLVLVTATSQSRRNSFGQSYRDFLDLRTQVKSVESLAAYRLVPANLSDGSGLPEGFTCVQISANGFGVTAKQPLLGRVFGPADESPDAPPVVLLTYRVWQDRYGGDPAILGRTIRVDDVPRSIIGVMPPTVRFPEDTDLWIPLVPSAKDTRNLMLFGRLAPGVSLKTARSEATVLATSLATSHPETFKGLVVGLTPFLEITGAYNARPFFLTMFCAVGFVLLIACADVANLFLARAAARSREISIRIAIGAGRARVIRQLLIESILLSLAGGFLGWLVALGGLRWFDAATSKFPRPAWLDLSMNPTVFTYLAAISVATGVLFGLAPALRLSRLDVNNAVKDGGHGAANAMKGRYLSNVLVAFEMALCVVLLAGAGLMIRSYLAMYGASLGVNPANVLTAELALPEAKYPRGEDEIAYHRRLKARLESLPGVEVAAVTSTLPINGWLNLGYQLDGHVNDEPVLAGGLIVSPDYFRVLQVHPSHGRLFTDGAAEAMVNESFAAKLGPVDNLIGKRIHLTETLNFKPQWLTVVGVIPDIQQDPRSLSPTPLIYVPYGTAPRRQGLVIARTRVPPGTLVAAFRREAQNEDPNLPLHDVRSLESHITQSRMEVGIIGTMFTIFAAIALVLASVGIYGVIAHSVSQRTREIGIRVAIGGSAYNILRLVFTQGLQPLLLGLAVGLPAAFGLTRVLRAELVGVSPRDPVTFAGVVVVLIAAGILGCVIPARRAVRIDPVIALRSD
jgi:predicted permease